MAELCKRLGIPRTTFNDWIKRDPKLAVKKPGRPRGVWWVKLDRLAGRHGIDLIEALMLGESGRWIKAVDIAKTIGWSRKRIQLWCRNNPKFAKRLGKIYYIDLETWGVSQEDIIKIQCRLGTQENPGSSIRENLYETPV